ncbi:MAG: Eco57I restriction-modification methylase domain-containing protein [Bacteroidota bacterium]
MELNYFLETDLYTGLQRLFKDLEVPVNYVTAEPTDLESVIPEKYNPQEEAHTIAGDVYFFGLVDDRAFAGARSARTVEQLRQDARGYNGLLIFGIELDRGGGKLPTRTQMTRITRDINRTFHYTPVVVVFRYAQNISLAAIERQEYRQKWREGERTGRIYLLRDIDLQNTHEGHRRILQKMRVPQSGKKAVHSYEDLYQHWQSVLDVSILNRKFYEELQSWFFWAVDTVRFPEEAGPANERNATGVIRMLTRIIFVWFLKERGLVREELFDREYLQEVLTWDEKTESTYYKAILQNLFFATLNTRMDKDGRYKRKWVSRQAGVQGFYRYKRFFSDPKQALQLFRDVPFLNGGLFECLDRHVGQPNEKRIDCFSDRKANEGRLTVPDKLFFGGEEEVDLTRHLEEKPKKKRTLLKVKGLFSILNRYKFTIAENTPVDQEVALDPELLGKVFENLLAAYNPETKSTARKSTGSFYTPREIVDYMVDESLIAYLKHELIGGIATDDLDARLRALFSFSEAQLFSEAECPQIIEKLNECKIIDPACGSGAFPMGILQKMVHVLRKLDPENQLWKAAQEAKARRELKRDLEQVRGIRNEAVREAAEKLLEDKLQAIRENFDPQANELDFARKLYLIENCIYGVDIQPIATQISKLRFFISLLVEQKIDDDDPNRGIIPLPNLETRFVAADSLIGLQRPTQMTLRDPKVEEKEEALIQVRREYFRARTTRTKERKRQQDKALREEIADLLVDEGWGDTTARKIADWDPYDQNAHADFFDMEWMLGVRPPAHGGGFDIVIGNPPYVQIQSFSGQPIQKAWAAQKYATFVRTGDIYSLFYEQGWRMLKPDAVLAYITSNKWMRTKYGEKTRKFFAECTDPLILIDFGMAQNFASATTYTNILLFRKTKNRKSTLACRIKRDYDQNVGLGEYFTRNRSLVSDYGEEGWVAYTAEEYALKQVVVGLGVILELKDEWKIQINYGIKTGLNDAFIIGDRYRNHLLQFDIKSDDILKKCLYGGKDVAKWFPAYNNWWLIGAHNGIKKKDVAPVDVPTDYPAVYKWLSSFGEKIRKRGDQGNHWTNLRNCAYWDYFGEPKIIYPNMTKYLPFCYDEVDHFYVNDKIFIITGEHLKYLTAVFNSSLWYFCFVDHFPELLGNTRELRKVFFEKIPIKLPRPEEEIPLERMTEYLAFCHRNQKEAEDALNMALFFEQLADGLVFELYFSERFAAYGKELRKYLTDLPQVTDFRDPGHFTDIRRTYRKYSDPEHPVAYHLSTLAEIPEVSLVRETNRENGHG